MNDPEHDPGRGEDNKEDQNEVHGEERFARPSPPASRRHQGQSQEHKHHRTCNSSPVEGVQEHNGRCKPSDSGDEEEGEYQEPEDDRPDGPWRASGHAPRFGVHHDATACPSGSSQGSQGVGTPCARSSARLGLCGSEAPSAFRTCRRTTANDIPVAFPRRSKGIQPVSESVCSNARAASTRSRPGGCE